MNSPPRALTFACLLALLVACPRAPRREGRPMERVASPAVTAPSPTPSPFELGWDPRTGKGAVTQTLPAGDRLRLCLQCEYPGYAGGLWIGSMEASGMAWTPPAPVRGYKELNLFCAQDESLWDHALDLEIDGGWSENFGVGSDGLRLEYVEGEVLEDGAGEAGLVLRAVSRHGCWELARYLGWPRGAAHLFVSSYLKNTCAEARRFSFWSGEDPWIGRYRSADGDVGWYAGGIVRHEARVDGAAFRHGGLYDLGNEALGQGPERFSGVANVVALDPGLEPPDVAYFANRFAHADHEIDPARPLDSRSLTALNLGWRDRELAPGAEWRLRYALGLAVTRDLGDLPAPPAITAGQWRFDEVYHAAYRSGLPAREEREARRPVPLPIRFKEEVIHLDVDEARLDVDALYIFQNRTRARQLITLFYPFPVDETHAFPDRVEVEGARYKAAKHGLLLRLRFGPGEDRAVTVRYSQAITRPPARYILTSTGAWGEPLDEAEYQVRWPAALEDVRVSYPGEITREGAQQVLRFSRSDFLPERDLVVDWRVAP